MADLPGYAESRARCGAVNPDRPQSRCVLEPGHKGRFHRSYLSKWEERRG